MLQVGCEAVRLECEILRCLDKKGRGREEKEKQTTATKKTKEKPKRQATCKKVTTATKWEHISLNLSRGCELREDPERTERTMVVNQPHVKEYREEALSAYVKQGQAALHSDKGSNFVIDIRFLRAIMVYCDRSE